MSVSTLEKLVTPKGIYASTAQGKAGMYYAFFGRDTAITAYLISQAENMGKKFRFMDYSTDALLSLMNWQSKKDDPANGQEIGKFAHEVRTDRQYYLHLTEDLIRQGQKSWYVDPADQALKNWDTNDATQLWVIVVSRLYERKKINLNKDILSALKLALIWCLRNMREHDGLAGYSYNPRRYWSGLINHTWKDSEYSYLHENGRKPEHPLKDVFVNALTWSALRYGSKIFANFDRPFSQLLDLKAHQLKNRFNDLKYGFLMKMSDDTYYFAEAIDKHGNKLTATSCDSALCLWAYCGNESIIETRYIKSVVKRVMRKDMFDEEAGIRTYSSEGDAYDPIAYHRGPNTFWPFVSALIADGLNNFGYGYETKKILKAMIIGIQKFNSCIEMFVKNGDSYNKFREPSTGQLSSTDQAWTAAALYYASSYFHP